MDASALLKSQGWRGKGYSLHPSNNNIGLSKPILIARNTDGRGVGQKPHVTSDTWWLDAFDQKLKGLDTSKKGTVTQSVSKGKLDAVAATGGKNGKYTGASGLYASFVSGGMLEGTLQFTSETSSKSTATSTDGTPISSSSEDDDSGVSTKKLSKKAKKESKKGETKQERKLRREARRLRREQKAATKEVRKMAKTDTKKALKAGETKEERRARRIERRARKEARRSKRAQEGGPPKG